jgi:5'-nucleotidase
MGLRLSAVGNHELDAGKVELLRQIQGGCQSPRPGKACRWRDGYPGSGFPYLAANLIDTGTGRPLLPAYRIEQSQGLKIAFVGAVLQDVAQMVRADGLRGLQTVDEADAINRLVPELQAQGVNAIVAIIHQGGQTSEAFDQPDCQHLQGPIVEVARRLDPAVDVLISGHSHQGYLCNVGPLLVTQGGSYGHLLTELTLQVTPGTHRVTARKARNLLADPQAYTPDPLLTAWVQALEVQSATTLSRPSGRLAVETVGTRLDRHGESPLGDLISDSHLEMTEHLGAQIAFMNVGGIRASLSLAPGQHQLTFAQLASVQPFNNNLVLMDLTGAQLLELLDGQWHGERFNPLQVSNGFSYRWDGRRPADHRVVPDSLRLHGEPVRSNQRYRVVANAFLAEGGDGCVTFRQGSRREDSGLMDLDATLAYLQARDLQGRPAGSLHSAGRIQRLD